MRLLFSPTTTGNGAAKAAPLDPFESRDWARAQLGLDSDRNTFPGIPTALISGVGMVAHHIYNRSFDSRLGPPENRSVSKLPAEAGALSETASAVASQTLTSAFARKFKLDRAEAAEQLKEFLTDNPIFAAAEAKVKGFADTTGKAWAARSVTADESISAVRRLVSNLAHTPLEVSSAGKVREVLSGFAGALVGPELQRAVAESYSGKYVDDCGDRGQFQRLNVAMQRIDMLRKILPDTGTDDKQAAVFALVLASDMLSAYGRERLSALSTQLKPVFEAASALTAFKNHDVARFAEDLVQPLREALVGYHALNTIERAAQNLRDRVFGGQTDSVISDKFNAVSFMNFDCLDGVLADTPTQNGVRFRLLGRSCRAASAGRLLQIDDNAVLAAICAPRGVNSTAEELLPGLGKLARCGALSAPFRACATGLIAESDLLRFVERTPLPRQFSTWGQLVDAELKEIAALRKDASIEPGIAAGIDRVCGQIRSKIEPLLKRADPRLTYGAPTSIEEHRALLDGAIGKIMIERETGLCRVLLAPTAGLPKDTARGADYLGVSFRYDAFGGIEHIKAYPVSAGGGNVDLALVDGRCRDTGQKVQVKVDTAYWFASRSRSSSRIEVAAPDLSQALKAAYPFVAPHLAA